MKSSSVRGTPMRSVNGGSEGYLTGQLAGYHGTVNTQYEGDQANRVNPASGTPLNNQRGNSADAKRVASHGTNMGEVISENGINMNDPESNGNGVVFDGVSRDRGYRPPGAPALDSPVPAGAQSPLLGAPVILNNLRSGTGKYYGPGEGPPDHFVGVMAREDADLEFNPKQD